MVAERLCTVCGYEMKMAPETTISVPHAEPSLAYTT